MEVASSKAASTSSRTCWTHDGAKAPGQAMIPSVSSPRRISSTSNISCWDGSVGTRRHYAVEQAGHPAVASAVQQDRLLDCIAPSGCPAVPEA